MLEGNVIFEGGDDCGKSLNRVGMPSAFGGKNTSAPVNVPGPTPPTASLPVTGSCTKMSPKQCDAVSTQFGAMIVA